MPSASSNGFAVKYPVSMTVKALSGERHSEYEDDK